MSRKEDVLLFVKHVRHKKVDGSLYVNTGRVAWKAQSSTSFKISANFEDIKMQRISPDAKDKVQLQLLMNNIESHTFQFADPEGREKQLEMRNKVKEKIQKLLPIFRSKAQDELQEKYKILDANPHLLALYKELVVTGILKADEFWARPEFSNNKSDYLQPEKPSNQKSTAPDSSYISKSFGIPDKPLDLGISNSLLSDIKPQTDGTQGVKYNLTFEVRAAIFKAYPTVKQRHRDLVPNKMTEQEFWVKFFQSHYFHKDRVKFGKDEIFADCATQDDRQLLLDLRKSRKLRVTGNLDLTMLTDDQVGEGYGSVAPESFDQPSVLDTPSSSADGKSGAAANKNRHDKTLNDMTTSRATSFIPSSRLSANQTLLRRFNTHSLLILRSLGLTEDAGAAYDQTESVRTRKRLYTNELSPEEEITRVDLNLRRVQDFLEGPASHTTSGKAPAVKRPLLTEEAVESALKHCQALVSAPPKLPRTFNRLLQPFEAQRVLSDISPGGYLAQSKFLDDPSGSDADGLEPLSKSRASNQTAILLSTEQKKELRMLYAGVGELLRHFWACFPLTSQCLIDKMERIKQSLDQFRSTKIAAYEAALSEASGGGAVSASAPGIAAKAPAVSFRLKATSHLQEMINVAFGKYAQYKQSKLVSEIKK